MDFPKLRIPRPSRRNRYSNRATARSCIQGRVGAPPLTHLRGVLAKPETRSAEAGAAIASKRNADGAAETWDADGAASLPRLTNRAAERVFSGCLWLPNWRRPGSHRDAATVTAREGAIREISMYSWLMNQHGFESPSIFDCRGFPVSKNHPFFLR